mgnify:FL=1
MNREDQLRAISALSDLRVRLAKSKMLALQSVEDQRQRLLDKEKAVHKESDEAARLYFSARFHELDRSRDGAAIFQSIAAGHRAADRLVHETAARVDRLAERCQMATAHRKDAAADVIRVTARRDLFQQVAEGVTREPRAMDETALEEDTQDCLCGRKQR